MSATFILYQSIHDTDGEEVDAHRYTANSPNHTGA